MPLPPSRKTAIFELCYNLESQSDLTTTFNYVDTDLGEVESSGPEIESLQILTATYRRASLHSWAAFVTWQNKDRAWSTPVQITDDLQADVETIEDLYTSVQNFAGRRFKILIGTKNISGSNRSFALVRAWLVVRYRS